MHMTVIVHLSMNPRTKNICIVKREPQFSGFFHCNSLNELLFLCARMQTKQLTEARACMHARNHYNYLITMENHGTKRGPQQLTKKSKNTLWRTSVRKGTNGRGPVMQPVLKTFNRGLGCMNFLKQRFGQQLLNELHLWSHI